jgi:hypothetical protein
MPLLSLILLALLCLALGAKRRRDEGESFAYVFKNLVLDSRCLPNRFAKVQKSASIK